jgi:hypothetical protein
VAWLGANPATLTCCINTAYAHTIRWEWLSLWSQLSLLSPRALRTRATIASASWLRDLQQSTNDASQGDKYDRDCVVNLLKLVAPQWLCCLTGPVAESTGTTCTLPAVNARCHLPPLPADALADA